MWTSLLQGVALGVVLFSLYALTRSFVRVDEGFVAVIVTFGAAERDADGKLVTRKSGLHFKFPWQTVILVNMKEQNLDLAGEDGGRTAMTEDGTVLRFDSILRYEPVPSALEEFLFGLRTPLEHITGLFTCLLRNEIANFRPTAGRDHGKVDEAPHSSSLVPAGDPSVLGPIADISAQGGSFALIRKERLRLNQSLEGFAQAKVGERYGVRFNAVDLIDILPPDELDAALNAVIQAQTEADALYFRAEGECRQRVLAASRGVAIAKTRAEAIEKEMDVLGASLATLEAENTLDAYVERRRDEVLSESRTTFLKDGGR
jgi:regulator of protease activity HflC (stomatin/prohibitin superfamily)